MIANIVTLTAIYPKLMIYYEVREAPTQQSCRFKEIKDKGMLQVT